MKVILEIEDDKAREFMAMIEGMEYVSVNEVEDYQEPTKEEVLEGIKDALQEVKLHQEGKIKLKSARQLLNEL